MASLHVVEYDEIETVPLAQVLPNDPDILYTPVPGETQLTFRAIATGCAIGGLVAAMNIYFGLRTGWSIGASLISAILGYSFFAALRPKLPFSVLETNITQTTGAAAGTMTSAAGLLAAIPAMKMLGFEVGYLELTLWSFAIANLGVFFAVPLRRQMVLVEKLRFPSGTATAETIVAMFSSGDETMGKASMLLRWGAIAAVFTLASFFIPQLGHPPMAWIGLAGVGAWGFSLLLSPLMFGAGMLTGLRVTASLVVGALFGWGVLGFGLVQRNGWVTGEIMSYASGARGWILWPGVAIMVGDALMSLLLSWPSMIAAFKPKKSSEVIHDPDGIPNSWWIGGLIAASVVTVILAQLVFDIPPMLSIIAIALSAVLSMVAVRSTGETDINPIGGIGKITQLVFGGLAPGAISTNLMSAAIAGAGASQAGDMMQDLKTGHMLGASPRKQLIAQLCGIPIGALVCVPIYALFDKAYTIGGEELPAPAAHAWRAMAELLVNGFGALPKHALWAMLGGLAFGCIVPLLKRVKSIAPYMPSALAFGIAFIIPPYYSIAMFLGTVMYLAWQKRSPATAVALSFAVSSGLIAGEGLMGIVTAILTLLGFGAVT